MRVIPAIDLKGGRCVRLTEGREASAKVYDRDPLEVARAYEKAGATLIHVVDLDGAFLGAASANLQIIKRINGEITIPIEVGGFPNNPVCSKKRLPLSAMQSSSASMRATARWRRAAGRKRRGLRPSSLPARSPRSASAASSTQTLRAMAG